MRIINFAMHPHYIEDGKSEAKFLKGTDIAFAVVEIPSDKYRLMPDDEKKDFQASMNLAEP